MAVESAYFIKWQVVNVEVRWLAYMQDAWISFLRDKVSTNKLQR